MADYLCTDWDGLQGHEGCKAVWVELDGDDRHRDAANIAIPILNTERENDTREQIGRGDPVPVENVYVVRVDDKRIFNVVERAELSPLQCCGGCPPERPLQHSQGCPEGVAGEDRPG